MAGEKLYIVEDEQPIRELLVKIFKMRGYEVESFSSVDAALEHMGWQADAPHLTRNLPDAIITDDDTQSQYRGLDLLQAAKDANIARIMASGSATQSEVMKYGGPQAILVKKPYPVSALLTPLATVLNGRRASI